MHAYVQEVTVLGFVLFALFCLFVIHGSWLCSLFSFFHICFFFGYVFTDPDCFLFSFLVSLFDEM